MTLKGCPACIKYLVFAFNLLFWILGLVMMGIGIWALCDPNIEEVIGITSTNVLIKALTTGSIIIIVIGAIMFITGFFGCCGAIRESQCCLALVRSLVLGTTCTWLVVILDLSHCETALVLDLFDDLEDNIKDKVPFFFVLLVIFLVLVAAAIFVLIGIPNESVGQGFKKLISDHLQNEIETFKKDTEKDMKGTVLVFLEKSLTCCGDKGQDDYDISPDKKTESCQKVIDDNKEKVTQTVGCTERLYELVKAHAIPVAVVTIAVSVLVLIAMILACTLCCAIRRTREYLMDDY